MDNGKLTSTIGGGSHGVISWGQNVFFLLNQVNKCQLNVSVNVYNVVDFRPN